MDSSDPLYSSNLSKKNERTPANQVATLKPPNVQRIVQMAQRVAQKSYRKVFQLFCCPVDALLCEDTCTTGQNHQPKVDKTTQGAIHSMPSTILIVNISNSTLIDCVIGNDTYPSAVVENQPLMQGQEVHGHSDQMRCTCSLGQQGATETSAPPFCPPLSAQEPPRISIYGSHLNCVIIGDNNYMQADQTG